MQERFIQDIYNEHDTEEAHVYVIQAKEVANAEEEEDEEFKGFFQQAKYSQYSDGQLMCRNRKDDDERKEKIKEEIMRAARDFKYFKAKDDYRDPNAGYYGGFQLTDAALTS